MYKPVTNRIKRLVSRARFAITIPWLTLILVLSSCPPAAASHFSRLSGQPGLRSASALVMDDSGHALYGKEADQVRPIASLTKLMTAMVALDSGVDLNEKITVTRDDRDRVQLTASRLEFGARLSRREMILLAIMSSENRAAAALGRTFPGGLQQFVDAMNAKAASLHMADSHFADPAGLRVENRSTARDLVRMAQAAYGYPLIRKAATTRRLEVHPYPKRGPLVYGNTNRLLANPNWHIELTKTGYLNESGRCLIMRATIDGDPLWMVFLDSFGKLTPFGDANRLRHWLLNGR